MQFKIFQGDCVDVMRSMPDNSVDSIVTDPPYGLGFMGHHWDHGVPSVEVWRECLRVLKPGGHLLAFAGTRTQHRMAVNIEDAGFEIRDLIAWIYGSGFPKSKNVGEGWGTALKPALEPITVARKPLVEKTVVANVLTHGTGAINIDGCRVEGRERTDYGLTSSTRTFVNTFGQPSESADFDSSKGRWPANLLHDGSDEVVALFPDSLGAGPSLPRVKITGYGDGAVGTGKSEYFGGERIPFNSGSGSAARFFYCAKASRSEREYGLEGLTDQVLARSTQAQAEAERGNTVDEASGGFNAARVRKNHHPTVKPVALMRYLARLVTPPGGTMLDMYCGSGSGLVGGILEGFKVIGIDLDRDDKGNPLGYIDIANARARRAQVEAFDAEMDGSEL